jgi:hypothetical protein
MFKRTHQHRFSIPKEHLKYRLLGHHVTIHDKDFQLLEEDQDLSMVPTADQAGSIASLPITQLELKEDGNKTEVVITSKMRETDSGGTLVLLLFCVFFFIASLILLFIGKEPIVAITLSGISVLIFIFFLIRMQVGYFDYVRKINTYIKDTGDEITTDVRRQLFKHKLK